MFAKVLALGGSWWVFVGGLTNLVVAVTVTQTATGVKKAYGNPGDRPFHTIIEERAFAIVEAEKVTAS